MQLHTTTIVLLVIFILHLITAVHNEGPCKERGCACFDQNSNQCSGSTHADFDGKYSCPTQSNSVVCCCGSVQPKGGGTGGAYNEPPCSSTAGCRCFDENTGSCSGSTHAKINGAYSCPNQKNSITCCCDSGVTPGGGGGGKGSTNIGGAHNEAPCSNTNGCTCYNQKSGSCSGTKHSKINGEFSCPTQNNDVICCCNPGINPNSGGGSGGGKGAIVSAANGKKGLPYVWEGGNYYGPTGGGFDCSGLSQYAVFQATGKKIPRTAQTQYDSGICERVGYGSRQTGDLIFWGNRAEGVYHVAIYTGNDRIVYAPTFGQVVKEGGLYDHSQIMPYVRRC